MTFQWILVNINTYGLFSFFFSFYNLRPQISNMVESMSHKICEMNEWITKSVCPSNRTVGKERNCPAMEEKRRKYHNPDNYMQRNWKFSKHVYLQSCWLQRQTAGLGGTRNFQTIYSFSCLVLNFRSSLDWTIDMGWSGQGRDTTEFQIFQTISSLLPLKF